MSALNNANESGSRGRMSREVSTGSKTEQAPVGCEKPAAGCRPMRRSTDRIITTHAGSLSRPEALRTAWSEPTRSPQQAAELQPFLRTSFGDIVDEQLRAGVDVPNDGEFGKPMRSVSDLAAWGTYI